MENGATDPNEGSVYSTARGDPFVVGVAASSVQAEAVSEILRHTPSENGLTFIIFPYDATEDDYISVGALSTCTSMTCVYVQEETIVEANHVYVVPPKKVVTVRSGKLCLIDVSTTIDSVLPIDNFMFELADAFGSRAVCVLFSGDGNYEPLGMDAINLANGLVIVAASNASTGARAEHDASERAHVEYVSSLQEIPQLIAEHAGFSGNPEEEPALEARLALFSLLQQATGVDFTLYKQPALLRRVQKRMRECGVNSLQEYNQVLRDDDSEISELQRRLLIGVTQFFRDPAAFSFVYDHVIPSIMGRRGDKRQIRIWVAGCSTGEEVYSMAILFKQAMRNAQRDMDVKIFATDADQASIQHAGRGLYPGTIARNLTAEQLGLYFIPAGDNYQIAKEIRSMVIFAQHNLLRDPPFSQLDLVVCRNFLIYLKPEAQKKVISLFLFALKPGAFLFLGPSETLGSFSTVFLAVNAKWNIFQVTHKIRSDSLDSVGQLGIRQSFQKQKIADRVREVNRNTKMDLLYNRLIEEYVQPFILVDENNEIVLINGVARDYLTISSGRPSHYLYKMVPAYLASVIRTALHRARTKQMETERSELISMAGMTKPAFCIYAKPLHVADRNLVLIFFEASTGVTDQASNVHDGVQGTPEAITLSDHAGRYIEELEFELSQAKETLLSTTEELDSSNEEFQTVNEELLVANEELQSANEELQSVNEELMAMNGESQRQIHELVELNDDMTNFFISTNIATLFLDSNTSIRKFTPAIAREINVIATDIGRPLGDLSHKLRYDELLADIDSVLHTGQEIEREVQSYSEKWFTARVLPYRTGDPGIQGAVLTLTDITGLRKMTDELLVLSYAISQSPGCILMTDTERRIKYINLEYSEQTGHSLHDLLDTKLQLYSDKMTDQELEAIWGTLGSGHNWVGELVNQNRNGEDYYEWVSLKPIKNNRGVITHYLKIGEDLTEKYKTIEILRKSELLSAVGQLAAGIAHEIRNPLTVLKGFIQLIAPDMRSTHYTDIMLAEFSRIEGIVNELLLLARPQETHFEKSNVLMILQDVMILLDTQAMLSNVAIEADYTEAVPWVDCVPNQLKQVFINILKNAIESMPQGGRVTVGVGWIRTDMVSIRITDEGRGVPDDKLANLGTPFYTTKENGTGLGLLVSAKIIENHHGRMEIRSQLGLGTTVEIFLQASGS